MVRTILFDVDGVMLSEERYFDASALTVWEMLHSGKYLGLPGDAFTPAPDEATIRRVRQTVFSNDEVLRFLKARGTNSNWDMVFLSFSYQLIRLCQYLREKHPAAAELLTGQINRAKLAQVADWAREAGDFAIDYKAFVADFGKGNAEKAELLLYLNQIAGERCGVETRIFSRNSELWELCQQTFQEWYLGDDLIAGSIGRETFQPGKKGFLTDEIPIVEPAKLREILLELKAKGLTLGIGTGRPTIETHVPLKELGLLELFEADRVVTASHVLDAETAYPQSAPLSKPHPYSYVKGYLGLDKPDAEVLNQPLPLPGAEEILIVGDSLADLMAARKMGCRFAATLTGLSGKEARSTFEKEKADYILEDVGEILTIFS
ncbi:HAD family hydrolase [Brevibacillus massiliensis]|uniref:HAD family hydrolase n=1 Tax=Brevibacillus massiliensis TaxID=1118054 RepID=UPI0002E8F07E|nr:HAD family hydrolase [Brevibacillus massiliensis]